MHGFVIQDKTPGGINAKEKNNQENITALGLQYENF